MSYFPKTPRGAYLSATLRVVKAWQRAAVFCRKFMKACEPAHFRPMVHPRSVLVVILATVVLFGCGEQQIAKVPTSDQLMNARLGSLLWQISNPSKRHEIEGYASAVSVERGETISLFVNTGDPTYSMEIFRLGWYNGQGATRMLPPIRRVGRRQPIPTPDPNTGIVECNWTDPLALPTADPRTGEPWPSGVYLVKLSASPSGKQSYITFVVRDDHRHSDILFQTSVNTYQAYNFWGGHSLYTKPRSYRVSFNRPYRNGYGSGDFLFWEYSLARFLEREGYDVTYTTDVDTHAHGELLPWHKAFLAVGHDEYWSWDMRNNIAAARERGVNLGFFGANIGYWQIRFEPSAVTGQANRTIVCYKSSVTDPLANDPDPRKRQLTTTQFRKPPVNRPEDALIGVMYDKALARADIVVQQPSSWVFEDTGVDQGDHLSGLLGYEADRMFDHAPAGTERIGHSPYDGNDTTIYSDMTIYQWRTGSKVFAAGSMQWNWGLDESFVLKGRAFANATAQAATQNILINFGALPNRSGQAASAP
jgi:hypothetical protein